MDKLKLHTQNITDKNILSIKNLFPNCVTETTDENGILKYAIDFEQLQQELSDTIIDGSQERYRLDWPGKRQALITANTPTSKTLRPYPDDNESVDFDTTKNLFIEGDNLDVLKLLQETYLGKVKMIYIDPPYNTGNDFVYRDNFTQDKSEHDLISGMRDQDGNQTLDTEKFKKNAETNGRFHSDWLSMIYPRLKLARNLLTDDGVIFISIDDNEQANLKKVCDEVFGEENFRNQIMIRRGAKSVQAQFETWDKLGQGIEYILFYTKNSSYRFPRQFKKLKEAVGGSWNNHWRGTDRPTMRYELFNIIPQTGQWRWGKDRSFTAIENYENMLFDLNETNESITQDKIDSYYENLQNHVDFIRLSKNGKPEHYIPPKETTLLNSSWNDLLIGSSSEILDLFDAKVFDTAKLTPVISRMLNFGTSNDIILDFFAGSGTTAHAVMALNAQDNGNRQFICVQIPEATDAKSEAFKAGYKNIAEISKERIRRAGAKIKADNPMFTGDVGFRVLKIDTSNMNAIYYTPDKTKQSDLLLAVDNIKPDRTADDLLFHVLLDWGVDLTLPIERKTIMDKTVFFVNTEPYDLIACFDTGITEDLITELTKTKPLRVVFRDNGFESDFVKINAYQIFKQLSPTSDVKTI